MLPASVSRCVRLDKARSRLMSGKTNGNGDETFFRAAWDTVAECERDHDVMVETELTPTKRKGVWLFTAVAVEMRPGPMMARPIVQYKVEFPNSSNLFFGGFLFSATQKLDGLVHAYRQSEQSAPRVMGR